MRPILLLLLAGFGTQPMVMDPGKPGMQLSRSFTVDSLGACQGISWLHGKAYLYGDREVGMIREFDLRGDSLLYTGHEYKLTMPVSRVRDRNMWNTNTNGMSPRLTMATMAGVMSWKASIF